MTIVNAVKILWFDGINFFFKLKSSNKEVNTQAEIYFIWPVIIIKIMFIKVYTPNNTIYCIVLKYLLL